MTEECPAASSTLPDLPAPRESRWWLSIPMVSMALILLYPVGLVALIRRRSRRRWTKVLAALAALPVFVLVMLVSLQRYWEFDGGMSLAGFRLDFSKGSAQFERVESHRRHQPSPASEMGVSNSGVNSAVEAVDLAALSWPAFRGEYRDGVVRDGTVISLDWRKDPPRERWRQPVGEGYASFVLGGGRLYTIEQRRDQEVIACYLADTGRELWTQGYDAYFKEQLGGDGPRATPTLDADRLYALGAAGQLTCLDIADGRIVWTRNILTGFGAENLQWGMSASPLIDGERLIVTNSGAGGGSIMAYRKADGTLIWQSEMGKQGYSSPIVATLLGRPMVLNFAAFELNGLDPQTGTRLWSFPWATGMGITCSQPIVVDDAHVFISLGYGIGSAMVELTQANGKITARPKWTSTRLKNKFTSSVIHDGAIYGLDETVMACLDLDTGKLNWKGGRYGYGSVLLVGDHLLVFGEYGELALVQATPTEHREIGRIRILEGKSWNNAALAGGLLFARNHKDMVCYDLRPAAQR
ncbi:MAG: PQQ-like beta-propeller repeat protein [Phycisphaerae bacterium]|nr:PQQ-like beta-propeller repeat protein [Phycisphaerae bacterium]